MNKKEIEQRLDNIPTDKYIYQRYNGIITKYIDNGEYYIHCKTGIATKKDEHLMLGKVSEEIIDLIEVGDYVNGTKVISIIDTYKKHLILENKIECVYTENINSILTKEQYEANCYKVGGEDE